MRDAAAGGRVVDAIVFRSEQISRDNDDIDEDGGCEEEEEEAVRLCCSQIILKRRGGDCGGVRVGDGCESGSEALARGLRRLENGGGGAGE